MSNLSVAERDGALVVDSRLIAQDLGIHHKNFLESLDGYRSLIEEAFGIIAFETRKSERGKPERFAYLNEDQATFAMTLSRNTDRVVQCKIALVKAFSEAKRKLKATLPTQSAELTTLITETNTLYGQFEAAVKEITPPLLIARQIGDRLLQLKAQIGHGDWEEFRETHIKSPLTGRPMPSSTASVYQRIAKHWDALQEVNALTVREAVSILTRRQNGLPDRPERVQTRPLTQSIARVRDQINLLNDGIAVVERLGVFSEYQQICLRNQIFGLLSEGNYQAFSEGFDNE